MKVQKKNSDKLWLGFDIECENRDLPKPLRMRFWKNSQYEKARPEEPLFYNTDALAALSLFNLHANWNKPNPSDMNFAQSAWRGLEPLVEMFQRSHYRALSMRTPNPEVSKHSEMLEAHFNETLTESLHDWGFDLENICKLEHSIAELEQNIGKPLIYNFDIALSEPTRKKMQWLHSMLFNLRALVATDYNAHCQDPTFEALKMDSITDYLPKADYVLNDALLYWQFTRTKDEMPAATFTKIKKFFYGYSHNGAYLIENLPKSFLSQIPTAEIGESLYLVQMDWLMGSDSGLLYQIREELYGLKEGYDQVFWPEMTRTNRRKSNLLSVQVQVSEELITGKRVA
jgi:hypothetical protein